MNKSREFGALLRRSSTTTVERILSLAFALSERTSDNDTGIDGNGADDWRSLSLASLLLVLRFCYPGAVPKFLFALGENGHLLRSADCGGSWKRVLPSPATARSLDSSPSAPGGTNATTANGDDEGAETLQSITRLLPQDEEVSREPANLVTTEGGVRRSEGGSVRCVAASRDIVACGGDDGLLSLSVNRGVTFQEFPRFFSEGLAEIETEKTQVTCIQVMPESPAVSNNFLVCGVMGKQLLVSRLCVTGLGKVATEVPKVSLTCTTPIVQLHCSGCTSPTSGGQITVSEHGSLHVSWDAGTTFWRVPHQLGYVRSLSTTACARHADLGRFPHTSRIVQSITSDEMTMTPAPQQGGGAETGSFEYATALSQIVSSDAGAALRLSCVRCLRHSASEDIFFTHLFVVGQGTDVLPYDFSCMLCIGVAIRHSAVITFSLAENVNYIPYVRSSLREPVCCLAQRLTRDGGGLILARGNSCGTSFSQDAITWTDPKKSAAVAVVAADGDAVLVVGQRSIVTRFGPDAVSSHVVPPSLRVPSLRSAVAL